MALLHGNFSRVAVDHFQVLVLIPEHPFTPRVLGILGAANGRNQRRLFTGVPRPLK